MSGGSLDYVYQRVDDAADAIGRRADTPLQHAFAVHLKKVATALHELEWVWSCDTSPGDEIDAIKAVVDKEQVLSVAIARADEARRQLVEVIKMAKTP